jgi:hypothetical protein
VQGGPYAGVYACPSVIFSTSLHTPYTHSDTIKKQKHARTAYTYTYLGTHTQAFTRKFTNTNALSWRFHTLVA